MKDFFEMMNRYSEIDASERIKKGQKFSYAKLLIDPIYNFLVRYFYRLGILDGWRGFVLSYLMAVYHLIVWVKVGEKALRASAYEDAIAAFCQGIELARALADKTAAAQQEAELQTALGCALIASRGFAVPEVGQAFNRARELCEEFGQTRLLVLALSGLDIFHGCRAEYDQEREAGERCLKLAQQ